MPLYEYRCTQCGYRFEKIQSFSAEPETECPKCHGSLMRPLTAPALQFKGAGWYVNDYASKSVASSESASENKTSDTAKAAPATESKPAAETKPAPASTTTSDSGSTKSSSAS